ncbi:MAG TPA: GNAT family N-acetyltransferase [Pyrinomonadaceae bacterium]|nr:GNAT family N-acetyltransferase [Pyrinomonadaceae bacterium]
MQLETDRLILRMWREDDFEQYAAMCADPEVMRFLGGKTFEPLEAWRHLAFIVGHWQLRGYGHWAVEEKASGELVGRIGFLNPEAGPVSSMAGRWPGSSGAAVTPAKARDVPSPTLLTNSIKST